MTTPNARDHIDTLAKEMRANSERWFPRWHSPDAWSPASPGGQSDG
jgi:hypothetical protein